MSNSRIQPQRVLKLVMFLSLAGMSVFLASCSTGGIGALYDPGYGPFDKDGNYLESEANKPAKQNRRPSVGSSSEEEEETVTEVVKKTQSTPKPVTVASTPKVSSPPKPVIQKTTPVSKPVVSTPPKPAFTYHTVKKGDTLYNISQRYNTSVGTIQSTNGISGSTIFLGQSLKIPK